MGFFDQAKQDKLPAITFNRIGDGFVGRIVSAPREVSVPAFDRDKGNETKLVLELEGTGRQTTKSKSKEGYEVIGDQTEVSGTYTLWVPTYGNIYFQFAKAIEEAGAAGLSEGGTVDITFVDVKDTGKAKPAKQYAVTYTPPVLPLAGRQLDEDF